MINFAKGYVRYLGDGGMKPATRTQGLLFQALFAAAMAFSMVLSVNLLLLSHDIPTSVSMLAGWPVWFAFAFLLRELYANRVACYVHRRWLERLNGPLQQVLFVAVNVILMAPVLCAAGVGNRPRSRRFWGSCRRWRAMSSWTSAPQCACASRNARGWSSTYRNRTHRLSPMRYATWLRSAARPILGASHLAGPKTGELWTRPWSTWA